MRYGYGYFEEDHLGNIGDIKIWKRILGFIRPVWNRVFIAVLLSLIITAAELTLPYLVRWAIDNYII
ncbi:MAG: ABC transporter ATP-binding protein, partial [Deltaproteobacteria bacterium]